MKKTKNEVLYKLLYSIFSIFTCTLIAVMVISCGGGGGGNENYKVPDFYLTPELVSSTMHFSILESSEQHTCGVTFSGSTYCWGTNEYGELGTSADMETCYDWLRGTFPCTGTPQQVETTVQFATLAGAQGASFTCGLTADGEAYCWGFGMGGQLGNGERFNSSTPVAVAGGIKFASIHVANGGSGACGLTTEGELYCWGPLGILFGHGLIDELHDVPVRAADDYRFVAFAIGELHACGVTADGQAYCWGSNWYGQLGAGSAGGEEGGLKQATEPVAVVNGPAFRSIVAGSDLSCALTETGDAYCWGNGFNTGTGSFDGGAVTTPQLVAGGYKFVSLQAGFIHTCGLTDAGEAYCWGQNYGGELGNGTQIESAIPVKVKLTQGFESLSQRPICGLTEEGLAYCWGSNPYGQVGRFPAFADQESQDAYVNGG